MSEPGEFDHLVERLGRQLNDGLAGLEDRVMKRMGEMEDRTVDRVERLDNRINGRIHRLDREVTSLREVKAREQGAAEERERLGLEESILPPPVAAVRSRRAHHRADRGTDWTKRTVALAGALASLLVAVAAIINGGAH